MRSTRERDKDNEDAMLDPKEKVGRGTACESKVSQHEASTSSYTEPTTTTSAGSRTKRTMVVQTGHMLGTHIIHHDDYGKYEQTGTSIYMHAQTPPPSRPPTMSGLASQNHLQPHAPQRHLHCTSGSLAGASGCTDRAKRPHAMHEGCLVALINFYFSAAENHPPFRRDCVWWLRGAATTTHTSSAVRRRLECVLVRLLYDFLGG
jgi:hypothetical protein